MTSEMNPVPPPPAPQPGFGHRFGTALGRFLKALFKLFLVLVLILGIGAISYLIVQELQRSFRVVSGRVDYNLAEVRELGHSLGTLEETVTAEQASQDARLRLLETSVNSTLTDDLNRQGEMLALLQLHVDRLITHSQTTDAQITALNEGAIALQGDINLNASRLDELGGELDGQANNTQELATQVTDLQTAVDALPLEDIEQMRQVVTLFRVWEMISRARLHLLENNVGLAANDTARALAAVEAAAANPQTPSALLSQLALLQARLTLANAYLPDNPELAALDLENGWRELDTLLALMLGVVEPVTAAEQIAPPEEAPPVAETPTPMPTPGG